MSFLHQAIKDSNDAQITWLLDHDADVNAPDVDGNTPLMLAVSNYLYPERIQALLERGADLHAKNPQGYTALMLALDHNEIEGVRVLMEYYAGRGEQADVDPRFEQGTLALLLAIHQGQIETIHRLLDAGADIDARNEFGYTPLMVATQVGRAGVVRAMLERGADVHAVEGDGNGFTALHVAASDFQIPQGCAQALLEHGAYVDARDKHGGTPLLWAAFSDSGETVCVLLEHGADVHAEAQDGDNPLAQAAWLADEETIRTLLAWGAGDNPDHLRQAFYACFTDNNLDKAPLFVRAGLPIGLSEALLLAWGAVNLGQQHRQAFYACLMNTDRDEVPLCVEAGLSTGLWDALLLFDQARFQRMLAEESADEINRALVTAARIADVQTVQMLLERGADPNGGEGNHAPLMVALSNGQRRKVIKALMDAGADVNARDKDGETVLLSLRPGDDDLDLVQQLLEYGADVNAQDVHGWTALMRAGVMGEPAVVRLLLQHGADADLRDNDGRTALMHAAEFGRTEIARSLLAHGAAVDVRDDNGRTALSFAQGWVGKGLVELLTQAGAKE